MDILQALTEKYDIDYDAAINKMTVKKPIDVSDFITLKNIAKFKNIDEIVVERKASWYEQLTNC